MDSCLAWRTQIYKKSLVNETNSNTTRETWEREREREREMGKEKQTEDKAPPLYTHTHTHTPLDHWTPIARGDDSDATAEAIATCAGIAPFNSLQG